MTIGTDRVQVLKQESSALGGNPADDVEFPSPIEPQEDALECAGVYFQDASNRDQLVYIERDMGVLRFRDTDNPTPLTLSSLTGAGSLPPATQVGQVMISTDGATFTVRLPVTGPNSWLVNDTGILIVNG